MTSPVLPVLIAPPVPSPTSPSDLAEIWGNILPLDDLQAKSPPERRLTLGRDIVPTLAMLSAANPQSPKLLQADTQGRLLAVAAPNGTARLLRAPDVNNTVVVDTPSLFAVGALMAHVQMPGDRAEAIRIDNVATNGTITLQRTPLTIWSVNDVVTNVPVTVQRPSIRQGNPVRVASDNVPQNAWTSVGQNIFLRRNVSILGITLGCASTTGVACELSLFEITTATRLIIASGIAGASGGWITDSMFPFPLWVDDFFFTDASVDVEVFVTQLNNFVRGTIYIATDFTE